MTCRSRGTVRSTRCHGRGERPTIREISESWPRCWPSTGTWCGTRPVGPAFSAFARCRRPKSAGTIRTDADASVSAGGRRDTGGRVDLGVSRSGTSGGSWLDGRARTAPRKGAPRRRSFAASAGTWRMQSTFSPAAWCRRSSSDLGRRRSREPSTRNTRPSLEKPSWRHSRDFCPEPGVDPLEEAVAAVRGLRQIWRLPSAALARRLART